MLLRILFVPVHPECFARLAEPEYNSIPNSPNAKSIGKRIASVESLQSSNYNRYAE